MKSMRIFSRTQRLFALLTLFAASAVIAFGQFESATVLGTVTDASDSPIAGAAVTLTNVRTGVSQSSKTDANGNFLFVNQRLGSYTVKAEQAGFKVGETSLFDVSVDARQRVDLKLQVGNVTESVTVSDAADILETDSSSRGQIINSREIAELPLNGRAYADLTLLVPGVAKSPLENASDSSRDASYNVNGQRSELNNFMLDGIDNNA